MNPIPFISGKVAPTTKTVAEAETASSLKQIIDWSTTALLDHGDHLLTAEKVLLQTRIRDAQSTLDASAKVTLGSLKAKQAQAKAMDEAAAVEQERAALFGSVEPQIRSALLPPEQEKIIRTEIEAGLRDGTIKNRDDIRAEISQFTSRYEQTKPKPVVEKEPKQTPVEKGREAAVVHVTKEIEVARLRGKAVQAQLLEDEDAADTAEKRAASVRKRVETAVLDQFLATPRKPAEVAAFLESIVTPEEATEYLASRDVTPKGEEAILVYLKSLPADVKKRLMRKREAKK